MFKNYQIALKLRVDSNIAFRMFRSEMRSNLDSLKFLAGTNGL